jgi:hypothetical protein
LTRVYPVDPAAAVVVVVVGGTVVVVVVVGGTVVVVVVVGGTVVVVVVVGGTLVVVVVVVGGDLPPLRPLPDFLAVGKVQVAAAQSWGWDATTTSTPGMVLKDHTLKGVPVSRQAKAGSLVVSWLKVPRYSGVPSDVGLFTAVRETVAPFQTPVDT